MGLVLVAWEVRQAKDIAEAQTVLDIAAQANAFNSETYGNREVAELVAAMTDHSHIEFSETQESMLSAAAWHFANIFWSAQRAHDHGLLGDDDNLMFQPSLAWHIENGPGLRSVYEPIYETAPCPGEETWQKPDSNKQTRLVAVVRLKHQSSFR